MAVTANEMSGPVPAAAPPVSAAQKKRPRLNPARRKSAKTQTEAQDGTPDSIPSLPMQDQSQAKASKNDGLAGRSNASSAKSNIKPANAQMSANVSPGQQTAVSRTLPARSSSGKSNSTKSRASDRSSKPGALALATPAMVTGGLVGCAAGAAVLLGTGLWKDFGGTDSAILAARTAKLCLDNLIEEIITSLKAGTYSTPEALDMLRRTTLAYASAIPGGAPFVERLFREIDMVRRQRGREVDKVVAEAYTELSKAGKRGASPAELQTIVLQNLLKLSTFAEKATQDIIARNPKLRPYRDRAAKALQPPPEPKMPTIKLNMALQHKPTAKA